MFETRGGYQNYIFQQDITLSMKSNLSEAVCLVRLKMRWVEARIKYELHNDYPSHLVEKARSQPD